MIISMRIGHTSEVYIWLSNKLLCKIYIRDTLNYLNSRCNTAKLLWVVIYVVCYGRFSPDLVVMNICRQRLIKVLSCLVYCFNRLLFFRRSSYLDTSSLVRRAVAPLYIVSCLVAPTGVGWRNCTFVWYYR